MGKENVIRTFLYLLASLLVSLIFGALTIYIGMETLPCHWFGTGFEGACAYGVLWTSIGVALAVSILSFAYLCYRVLRLRKKAQSSLNKPV